MLTLRQPSPRAIAAMLRTAGCLIGLAVMLVLPTFVTHHFQPLYRTTQVPQSAARHAFLTRPGASAVEGIGQDEAEPTELVLHDYENLAEPVSSFEPAPPVRLARWLKRLKLLSARATASDPLLQSA